ncbi:hypothetical protein HX049_17895 [Myroides odoratimimus]|uniref:hypothetical protein n=1 Tax=Myroides odoratimimus TaxID=76832 RepID=UPI0025756450|nr:hypothetical protein [Myroides odoratimimus]MDM1399009.1 hypothetical protein [Myroides odoratimimus]
MNEEKEEFRKSITTNIEAREAKEGIVSRSNKELTLFDIDNLEISPSLEVEQYIHLANDFRKEYLMLYDNDSKDYLLEFTVVSLRVMVKIISDLRRNTFKINAEESEKRNLDNYNYWQGIKNREDTSIQFRYKTKDFVSNRSRKILEEGLVFLKRYKEQWYSITKSNGKTYRTHGGLLENFYIDDNKGEFIVLVNTYWVDKIIDLSNNYSILFTEHLNQLTDVKKMLFYTMIMSMSDNGLRVRKEWFNQYFNLNYKYYANLKDNFIDKVKAICDQPVKGGIKEQRSFYYYEDKEDSSRIIFKPIILKPNIQIASSNTIDKQSFNYKIAYYKLRHKLSDEQRNFLRDRMSPRKEGAYWIENDNYTVFNSTYQEFLNKCKSEGVKPVSVQGEDFIIVIKELLKSKGYSFLE